MMHAVRQPAVAGSFYPADPGQLVAIIEQLLAEAAAEVPAGTPVPKALIAPHAGYVYSGPTAARAYATLAPARATITRVVLAGPTHRVPVRGVATPGADAFRTPLGDIPVEIPEALRSVPHVVRSPDVHRWEHSLEVHLPFLQVALEAFTLVPLAVGDATPEQVADALDAVWGGPETLIVASSDLSHYLRYEKANEVDAAAIAQVLAGGPPLTHRQACGAGPINGLLLAAARHGLAPDLLDHCNSGDTAGDHGRVVGYAAVAFREASHA